MNEPMLQYPNTPGGYRIDLEDYDNLNAISEPVLQAVRTYSGSFSAPEEIDPRPFWRIRNQGRQGSCQGHGVAAAFSWTFKIATGDATLDLSEQWAYIMSQKKDGIRGDSGSTLSGGARTAKEDGMCREQFWPYPNGYQTSPPNWDACREDAQRYKAKTVERLKSYDDIFEWISTGLGGVWIGISWGSSMSGSVVERFRAGGGGHSVAFLGYSRRKQNGKNYLWLANSWGTNWGNRGWCEVSPQAVTDMANHRYTVFMGMSDLHGDGIKPRTIDWLNNSYMN